MANQSRQTGNWDELINFVAKQLGQANLKDQEGARTAAAEIVNEVSAEVSAEVAAETAAETAAAVAGRASTTASTPTQD